MFTYRTLKQGLEDAIQGGVVAVGTTLMHGNGLDLSGFNLAEGEHLLVVFAGAALSVLAKAFIAARNNGTADSGGGEGEGS